MLWKFPHNFQISIFSNYSPNLSKIYLLQFSWHLLKLHQNYQLSNLPKKFQISFNIFFNSFINTFSRKFLLHIQKILPYSIFFKFLKSFSNFLYIFIIFVPKNFPIGACYKHFWRICWNFSALDWVSEELSRTRKNFSADARTTLGTRRGISKISPQVLGPPCTQKIDAYAGKWKE